jgi:hypothetical protein
MKSIKEKAEEYGLLNPDIHYDADGNTYDDVDNPSMDFEAGANYVLDKIEKLTNNQNWCAFPKQSHKELKELIEQLKK